jgi:hypothetical protein
VFLEKTFYNRDDVSLAGFRVFGFVGARGVIFLINGTLSYTQPTLQYGYEQLKPTPVRGGRKKKGKSAFSSISVSN